MIELHVITERGPVLVAQVDELNRLKPAWVLAFRLAQVVDDRLVERPEPDLPAAEEAAARTAWPSVVILGNQINVPTGPACDPEK